MSERDTMEYRMAYKLFTGAGDWNFTNSIATISDVSSARRNRGFDKVGTLDVAIPNPDGQYSTGSGASGDGSIDVDQRAKFQVSTDGGSSYQDYFVGYIRDKTMAEDKKGSKHVQLAIFDQLDQRDIVDVNQGVLFGRNVNEVFQGTTLSSNNWLTDGDGNYPNGLLYNTGLTYSADAVTQRFATLKADVDQYILPRKKQVEVCKDVADWFGCHFWIDDPTSSHFMFTNTYSSVPLTLSSGIDLGDNQVSYDTADKVDGVIVIGEDAIQYGAYKDGADSDSNRVLIVKDDRVNTPIEGLNRSTEVLNLYTSSYITGRMTVPGLTGSYIGKTITVENNANGWTGLGNVIQQTDELDSDHFASKLSFENIDYNIAEDFETDLITRLKDLEEKQAERDTREFLGYLKITGSSGGGAHYGKTYFLGIGTSSTGGTASPSKLIDILPTAQILTQSSTTTSTFVLPPGRDYLNNARHLEYLLFNTDGSGADDDEQYGISASTTIESFARPASQADWDGTASETVLSKYVTHIQDVRIDGMAVKWGDNTQETTHGKLLYHTASDDYVTELRDRTASMWNSADDTATFDFETDDYTNIRNDEFTPTSWWGVTMSGDAGSDGERPIVFGKIQLPGIDQLQDTDELEYHIIGRAWGLTGSEGTGINNFSVCMAGYNEGSTSETAPDTQDAAQDDNTAEGTWIHCSDTVGTRTLVANNVQNALYFAIAPEAHTDHPDASPAPLGSYTGSTTYLDIAYFDMILHRGVPMYRIAPATPIDNGSALRVAYPIGDVNGIFTNSAGTGNNFLYGQIHNKLLDREGSVNHGHHPLIVTAHHMDRFIEDWRGGNIIFHPDRRRDIDAFRYTQGVTWDNGEATLFKPHEWFVSYLPLNEYDDKYLTRYRENHDFEIVRSKDGSAADKIKWYMGTTDTVTPRTASLQAQGFPPYGAKVTIQYHHVGKDTSEGDIVKRWTASDYPNHPGIYKTTMKSLQVDFMED